MSEQKKWFLEMESTPGVDIVKIIEMTTKDLEHNLNLVEKSSSRLQKMNSNFERRRHLKDVPAIFLSG